VQFWWSVVSISLVSEISKPSFSCLVQACFPSFQRNSYIFSHDFVLA